MKKVTIVFIVIFLQGCHSESITNNSEIKKRTDKIPVQKIIYDIVVDSTNSIFDTISERKIKTNNSFIKIYEEKVSFENKKTVSNTKSYFSNAGNLIYEKTELLNMKVVSIFEAIEKDKMIRTSKTVTHFPNQIHDSIVLKYNYKYENHVLKKLCVFENQDKIKKSKKVIIYNDLEKPIIEFLEFQNDTIYKKSYSYKNRKLIMCVHYNFKNETKTISFFNEKEEINYEQFYLKVENNFVENKRTKYKRNAKGDLLIDEKLYN